MPQRQEQTSPQNKPMKFLTSAQNQTPTPTQQKLITQLNTMPAPLPSVDREFSNKPKRQSKKTTSSSKNKTKPKLVPTAPSTSTPSYLSQIQKRHRH
jgi:hypothetical protein